MLQYFLDSEILPDEDDDLHGMQTPGTYQRVYLVDFPDQSCPFCSALFLIMGEVLISRRDSEGCRFIFLPQPPAFVTVPAIVSHDLLSLVGDM